MYALCIEPLTSWFPCWKTFAMSSLVIKDLDIVITVLLLVLKSCRGPIASSRSPWTVSGRLLWLVERPGASFRRRRLGSFAYHRVRWPEEEQTGAESNRQTIFEYWRNCGFIQTPGLEGGDKLFWMEGKRHSSMLMFDVKICVGAGKFLRGWGELEVFRGGESPLQY